MSSAFWDAVVPDEEVDRGDEALNRELRWRELRRHLDGVRTILDVGGGTGAFSIPLAEQGFTVTHLDISPAMLAAARAKSARPAYVEGDAADLAFADASFDLVLNTDGAISFAGGAASRVLAETCRVGRKVFVTVSHRATMTATWLKYSLRATGRVLPAVSEMLRTGRWEADQFPENALIFPAVCDVPHLKAFTRAELTAALEANGLTVLAARPLGSLGYLMLPHGIAATTDLADIAEELDTFFDGPGAFRRAGLLGVGERR